MLNIKDFTNLLIKNKFLTPIYQYELTLIEEQIETLPNYQEYLKIIAIYFSYLLDGNLCIKLDQDALTKDFKEKCDGIKVMQDNSDSSEIDLIYQEATYAFNYLDSISCANLKEIIGDNKLFVIENGYLYTRINNYARSNVITSIKRLFAYNNEIELDFNYLDYSSGIRLASKQEEVITKGLKHNLLVTGGPGTGKTTSIIFLLLALLKQNINQVVYLCAPSGKAASRMEESINSNIRFINSEFKDSKEVEKIKMAKGQTIHTMLGSDYANGAFKHHKNNQFAQNSIFVIDEASMIDVVLFSSLLDAIPTGARVFILGDKDQLPSVGCGAVFGDLLEMKGLEDSVVKLDQSNRFRNDTCIYELANIINNNLALPLINWQNYHDFKLYPNQLEIDKAKETNPIYYYSDEVNNPKEMMNHILDKWVDFFYNDNENLCSNISQDNAKEAFGKGEKVIDKARILCAENEGVRGVKYINDYIAKKCYGGSNYHNRLGYYPGEIVMINKNNKLLDLYNGDTGILVTFKDCNTLYFMIKKNSKLFEVSDWIKEDRIFKLDDYMFYPLSMIPTGEYSLAYAITIHKSQGSDYLNILVTLPNKKGHPLLNRQIVYTAITRTKSNTYILSNQERLLEAKERIIKRITNIK